MRKITNELIKKFKEYLIDEEKSAATLDKYVRDIAVFMHWSNNQKDTARASAVEVMFLQNTDTYSRDG